MVWRVEVVVVIGLFMAIRYSYLDAHSLTPCKGELRELRGYEDHP